MSNVGGKANELRDKIFSLMLTGKGSSDSAVSMSGFGLSSQPVDATHALNLSAGVSNCNVFLGRSFNWRAILLRAL
jgi:hypothetical protein